MTPITRVLLDWSPTIAFTFYLFSCDLETHSNLFFNGRNHDFTLFVIFRVLFFVRFGADAAAALDDGSSFRETNNPENETEKKP